MSIRMFALATAMTVGASAATAQTSYNCGDPVNFALQLCIDACANPANVAKQACVNLNAANASSASNLGLPTVGTTGGVTNFATFIVPGALAAGVAAAIASGGSSTSTTGTN